MAADKWLEEELAELNEAELIIQQTMSDFLPVANGDVNKGQSASKPKSKPEVTSSIPVHKVDHDVDRLTSQFISHFDTGKPKENYESFNLPPPPDIDDFIINTKEDKPASPPPPPPPAVTKSKSPPQQNKAPPPPVMSKPAPPPVLPKPSRSTALTGKSKASVKKGDTKKPDDAPASKPPPPAAGIPKDIEKNSMAELDFLTSNLLSNMEHPKDEDFYGYCDKCSGVVEGEKVGCNALGGVYHITCFTCVTCKQELHGEPFFAVEKTTYCENCYVASLERCTVCSETITDRILRATGKPYHPECFKCCECGKSLDGIPFTTDDSDKIYCVECYHQKFAPRCSVCEEAILPEPGKEETVRIVALDRSFHVKCYKCEKCQSQLSSDKGCYPIDNHIYCLNCNTVLLQQAA